MEILLTGFKNSSANILLDKISNNYDKFLFTSDYTTIIDEIDKLFALSKYDYIIMFGQKPLIKDLRIETICKSKEDVLKTNFPIEGLIKILVQNNISYKLSRNPGTSYCNFAYYNVLKCLDARGFKGKVVFIHIPYIENFIEMDKVINLFKIEKE